MKNISRSTIAALCILAALPFGPLACQNDAQTGALIGSAVGAAAGAGIDHKKRGRGALIGAGVGAGAGYIIGNESDKSKNSNRY